jgi:two-component system heavy metal sensor histidine kinase CusS
VLATVVAMELVVRLLLRPVDRLAMRIAAIDPDRLVLGVDGCQVPREMEPVVRRLEDLLQRLATAFRRERAFADDVAHELRTPLSGLRTTIEVILAKDREVPEYREALNECLGICLQTQGLVDNLLALARAEGGQLVPQCIELEIDRVMEESWRLLDREVRERNLSCRWTVPALKVIADAGLLRLLFTNLFANATAYADKDGLVMVDAADVGGRVEVTIANTGCQLQPEQAERVFDRFWRGDHARKSTGTHAGLGLALCRTLVTLHGGSIVARVGNGWFTVTVRLPGPPAAGQAG